jgi:hypothetical protein
MNNGMAVDLNDSMAIRSAGLDALKTVLGYAGMVRFIQQYEHGKGVYTKEKYSKPDMSLEELDSLLKARQQQKGRQA